MSLTDKSKTSTDEHQHEHEHEHDHVHAHDNDHDSDIGQDSLDPNNGVSNPTPHDNIFKLVKNYQGDRFKPVDDQTRKTFYQSLVGRPFRIENSDFISLDNANFQFEYTPAHDDHHCDLNVIVSHKKRKPIVLTAYEESILTFLSEKNFVIKSFMKLDDNKVHSKYYAMTISVVDNEPTFNYVFSFSFTNLDDHDDKIRVYFNHKQPATAGVGRD